MTPALFPRLPGNEDGTKIGSEVFAGQTALVTGASSGIGRATAKLLAENGAAVAVTARRETRLAELATEIEDNGGTVETIPTDITDLEEVREMVRTTTDQLGGPDILVNSAGVMLLAPVERADPEDYRQMVEVNLLGVMNTTRLALEPMLEQNAGHVVTISSIAGRRAEEWGSGYSATKFGVNAFSESLRKEVLDSDVRVTVIEPGAVQTELGQHIPNDRVRDHISDMVEDLHALDPADIARSIVFAVAQPPEVCVSEVVIRPTDQR